MADPLNLAEFSDTEASVSDIYAGKYGVERA